MKAVEAQLLAFLRKSPQFAIPIYQRTYSWAERECLQLWNDILRAGSDEAIPGHFIGSVVYIEPSQFQVTHTSPLLVIDGQQRLTTISLLLEAVARHLGDDEPVDGFSARKLRNYYLLNPEEKGERAFKLLLTQTDKESLLAAVQQRAWPQNLSLRVTQNFELFERLVAGLGTRLPALCQGLSKLMIVDVSLNRDYDNPQLIFESMNSTGRELSQADLIRNYILMGLEPAHQTRLYTNEWRPMEVAFGQEAYGTHFDSFMRHFLTVKTGDIPNVREVYEAFKAYARRPNVAAAGIDNLVQDIHKYARHYCKMALGQEPDKELAEAFHDLRELRVDVAYPFLLELYDNYSTGLLQKSDFAKVVRFIEAYVFRRAVCAIPTNSLNKTFATLGRTVDKTRYLESIQAQFLLMPSYRRFPSDVDFQREFKNRDLYNFPRRSYWLRRLENHGRLERVPVNEYTIEHIMPQNPNLSATWKQALGDEWERVHKQWLHTLGNLTLTAYNPDYSDRPFDVKRDMPDAPEKGLKLSPLKLNAGLGQVDRWDESAIQTRAERLAAMATSVWAPPSLPAATLRAYRPGSQAPASGYTIQDHPHLALGRPMRQLFEAFRKEVLALDPDVVTEEFLKLYVAYKAETNFVDVEPQAARLRLTLNMPFHEVVDPRGVCRDITNLGRWGNGDVEVGLSSFGELPYVMGLVRQAYEMQMGNGESPA